MVKLIPIKCEHDLKVFITSWILLPPETSQRTLPLVN